MSGAQKAVALPHAEHPETATRTVFVVLDRLRNVAPHPRLRCKPIDSAYSHTERAHPAILCSTQKSYHSAPLQAEKRTVVETFNNTIANVRMGTTENNGHVVVKGRTHEGCRGSRMVARSHTTTPLKIGAKPSKFCQTNVKKVGGMAQSRWGGRHTGTIRRFPFCSVAQERECSLVDVADVPSV